MKRLQVMPPFIAGDPVIFRISKRSTHPGPRARHIRPEPCGDGYSYEVTKYWRVVEVRGDTLVLITRRGKLHATGRTHPNLRKANLWERLVERDRFPSREAVNAVLANPAPGNRATQGAPSPR